MLYIVIILSLAVVYFLTKLRLMKRQIKNLTAQVGRLSEGATEKMLDISLIDRDLENLAGLLNKHYARQRTIVAGSLHHESRLKDSIADISHDLRTPLTVIMGHLQLLKCSELSVSQLGRVQAALEKSYRMKEQIDQFYEFSLIEADAVSPYFERINLTNFLIDFFALNAPLFEDRQLSPDIRLGDVSVYVSTDRDMLDRILQNIISNAVRYSAGEIRFALYAGTDGEVVMDVENNLAEPEHLDISRLFDRFYTGDKPRHSESTGLGLAIARLLTEKMGGTLQASLVQDMLSIQVRLKIQA